MSWDFETVATAIADTLDAALECAVFAFPPETLNPPALVVSYPDTVTFGTTALGVDTATIPVSVVTGSTSRAELSALVTQSRAAIQSDRKLGGAVANARATELRGFEQRNVAGIDVLTAALVVVVDC